MRILVTGGSGFIGTNLVQRLLDLGHTVRSFDSALPKDSAHRAHFVQADLVDAAALKSAVREYQPTEVIHLAARTDLDEQTSLAGYAANTTGVRNLLDALDDLPGLARVLFASTKLVCRTDYCPTHDEDYCPDTLYGESKVEGERIVRGAGTLPYAWCFVRPTSIWGPWCGIPYRGFFEAIARNRYVHLGSADEPKRFGYVGNAVHQLEELLLAPAASMQGKVFYLADYEPYTIRGWADSISRAMNLRPAKTLPRALCWGAALAGDVLQKTGMRNPPLTSFRLRNMWADTSRVPLDTMRSVAPTLPYAMDAGVEETVRWLRTQSV